jgi:ANTAR domain-containing protein/GAF domain-containing protein
MIAQLEASSLCERIQRTVIGSAGMERDDVELAHAFVELADTLTDAYDVVEHLHTLASRCVELVDVDAAGVLLNDSGDRLRMISSSHESPHLVDLLELLSNEGPGYEAFHRGELVSCPDLSQPTDSRHRLSVAAICDGYASVHALPMRLREQRIGSVMLFRVRTGALDPHESAIAQALTDVATIGMLQQRAQARQELLTGQLQTALNSRVVIEQAKGVLAERRSLFMEQAFDELRSFARSHNRRLSDVAYAVVRNAPDVIPLMERSPSRRTG